jgi:hypothetical protein
MRLLWWLFELKFVLLTWGTVVEGTIQQLFEGHHMNYIECINVEGSLRKAGR